MACPRTNPSVGWGVVVMALGVISTGASVS